ncbi:hypothetical protein B0H14DRAFT_2612138 [Mycena olivaceomarginata]|nr:hypothetical protein B0H14DRAFT_2612138 [Mycena olivaceomarginata]
MKPSREHAGGWFIRLSPSLSSSLFFHYHLLAPHSLSTFAFLNPQEDVDHFSHPQRIRTANKHRSMLGTQSPQAIITRQFHIPPPPTHCPSIACLPSSYTPLVAANVPAESSTEISPQADIKASRGSRQLYAVVPPADRCTADPVPLDKRVEVGQATAYSLVLKREGYTENKYEKSGNHLHKATQPHPNSQVLCATSGISRSGGAGILDKGTDWLHVNSVQMVGELERRGPPQMQHRVFVFALICP